MEKTFFAAELQEWLTQVAASGKINNLASAAMLCRALEKRVCDHAENFGIERSAAEDSFSLAVNGEAYEPDLELHRLLGIEAPEELELESQLERKPQKKRKLAAV